MANHEATPIRVVIVDDHSVVRRGLRAYLRTVSDVEVVGEAVNGQAAVDLCEQIQPDVVLMDLVMPELGGAAATRIIRHRWPQVQVIALTSFQEQELVQDAVRAGAISYLLKGVSGEDLAQAIRAAHGGRSILAPEIIEALGEAEALESASVYDLTPRELEILALLVRGLNKTEIGVELGISPATTEAHVGTILSKLQVSSRAEAISVAMEQELVS
jgi:NarL family two-component system response regulator LiaR